MMRRRRAVLAALALAGTLPLLGGCVSPAEQRYADDGRCSSYGFRPGTDGYATCLQRLDLNRAADRRALLDRPFYGGFGYGYGYGPGRFWY